MRSLRARIAVAATAGLLALAVPAAAAIADPASTSSTAGSSPRTLAEAKERKSDADARVDELRDRRRAQDARIDALTDEAAAADAAYQAQIPVQQAAQAVQDAALIQQAAAQAGFNGSHAKLMSILRTRYMGGAPTTTGALLTAASPADLLLAVDYANHLRRNQNAIVAQAQLDLDAMNAAEDRSRAALDAVTAVTQARAVAKEGADAALAGARAEADATEAELQGALDDQASAVSVLSLFLGGWSSGNPAQAAALMAQYKGIAASAKDQPDAPSTGSWTAEAGQSAVNRALQYLGISYAWAGGGLSGPGWGTAVDEASAGDGSKFGFDCSGLMMYGWAPYLSMAHYAATQYLAGSVHPSPGELLPGDMLFWSDGGTVAGIHHVAMYVGDGNVVQAPSSGDIVRITPMGSVASGYFGATRPLT